MKHIFIVPLLLLPSMSCLAEPLTPVGESALQHLTLTDAEQMWRLRNRELRIAQDQITAAAADKLIAKQRPNPQLSLNDSALNTGNDAPPLGSSTFAQSDIVLRIDQTIERGDKRELRMREASLRLSAARQDWADAQRQGRISLDQAYYDLVLSQENLHIAEDNAHLSHQLEDAALSRLKVGDISSSELSRIRVEALRSDNDVLLSQNELKEAQAGLAYLIGAEQRASVIRAADAWPSIISLREIVPDVETRPDVQAAVARVAAAKAARDLAMALKTRDVTVGIQVERNGSNPPLHSVGFGISVPLMTGYQYQGEIAHAEADLQAERDALDQTRAQAVTEVNKSRSDLESAIERVHRLDDTLRPEAKRVLNFTEFAYSKGALSVMDLLDARRTYKAVQMDAASAHADYAKSLVRWAYANGNEGLK